MDFNSNSEAVQRGRKKVYSANEKLELILPNGDKDGFLEKGDLIYVVTKKEGEGDNSLQFRVIKFGETKKEANVYFGSEEYFTPYYENEETASNVKVVDFSKAKTYNKEDVKSTTKSNYTVPSVTGIGGGIFGYMYANKYQKNKLMFALGGLAIGLAVGVFIVYNKQNKTK
jgi:hypothetical protein